MYHMNQLRPLYNIIRHLCYDDKWGDVSSVMNIPENVPKMTQHLYVRKICPIFLRNDWCAVSVWFII